MKQNLPFIVALWYKKKFLLLFIAAFWYKKKFPHSETQGLHKGTPLCAS